MIRIQGVRAGILSIPACSIHRGICAVAGPNGSGKTTFLKLLSGILTPASGTVLINAKSPDACTIGWVGEYPDRNMLFTRVFDELASPLRFARHTCTDIDQTVCQCAEDLGIKHLLSRDIHELSGGELVLVAFGTACITKPDLLILDETDSHLDDEFCRHLDLVIRKAGIRYVIFSTHRPERMAVADEIILLECGHIHSHSSLSQPGNRHFNDLLNDPVFWRKVSACETDEENLCR